MSRKYAIEMSSAIMSSLAASKRMGASKYTANEDETEAEVEQSNVKVVDNEIYFYADVDSASILETTTILAKLIKEMQIFGIMFGIEPPPITLRINSEGGEVHAALSLYDFIKRSPVKIITTITGSACSAATIISLAGHERYITKNSYMLIHNISSAFWGKMHEFEDEMKNVKLAGNLKTIYKKMVKLTSALLKVCKEDLLLMPIHVSNMVVQEILE